MVPATIPSLVQRFEEVVKGDGLHRLELLRAAPKESASTDAVAAQCVAENFALSAMPVKANYPVDTLPLSLISWSTMTAL
jgi:hypothetical protein